jgi:hypothetical protein
MADEVAGFAYSWNGSRLHKIRKLKKLIKNLMKM